jgi:hypothetical protein
VETLISAAVAVVIMAQLLVAGTLLTVVAAVAEVTRGAPLRVGAGTASMEARAAAGDPTRGRMALVDFLSKAATAARAALLLLPGRNRLAEVVAPRMRIVVLAVMAVSMSMFSRLRLNLRV